MLKTSSLIKAPIFSSIIRFSEMFPRIWGMSGPPRWRASVLRVAWSAANCRTLCSSLQNGAWSAPALSCRGCGALGFPGHQRAHLRDSWLSEVMISENLEKLPLRDSSLESDLRASITSQSLPPQWFLGSTLSSHAWRLTCELCMHLSGLLTSVRHSGIRVKGGQRS